MKKTISLFVYQFEGKPRNGTEKDIRAQSLMEKVKTKMMKEKNSYFEKKNLNFD